MRILVADDEEKIVELIKTFLVKKGHSVDIAADGRAALDLINKNNYDVAFFDHNMPELTGLELIKIIKQGDIKTKVVLLTGYPAMKDVLAKSIGADGYLNKPCSLEDIEAVINGFSKRA